MGEPGKLREARRVGGNLAFVNISREMKTRVKLWKKVFESYIALAFVDCKREMGESGTAHPIYYILNKGEAAKLKLGMSEKDVRLRGRKTEI